ncbi:MAG: methyltransferase [Rhodoluna sp.]|nr:methyltransferase [Rhodoluna sp.]
MSDNHYFASSPEGPLVPREITVTLNGNKYSVLTAGGVFSPEHIDQGTQVLLAHLEKANPSGNFLDIGCGWGPIALALALHSPKATIYAIDVNERSLELTKLNAERLGLSNIVVCKPEEVPSEIEFDEIWSNPPIRVGKVVLHEILTLWINRLTSGGTARFVVQKNLGSDSLHKWLIQEFDDEFESTRIDTSKTFRVLKVSRA